MTIKIVTAYTWECNIPQCPETITAYGEKYAEEHGWWTGEMVFGHDMDICPDHTKQLRKFLFDEQS